MPYQISIEFDPIDSNMLVSDERERGPADALRYQFETVSHMSAHEQEVVRELLDALIVNNQVAGALERVTKPAAKGKATGTHRTGTRG